MDSDRVDQPSVPPLCANGCGFFANVGSMGMCSKCFREAHAREQATQKTVASVASALAQPAAQAPHAPAPPAPAEAEARAAEAAAVPAEPGPSAQPEAAGTSSSAPDAGAAAPSPSDPGPTRCFCCRKKTGLTGFKCRCGHNFCGTHRYAEAHNCTFDYKGVGRQQLATNNPLVQASKVQKF